jgi:DNA-binding transcriptional regulator YdaS (Cro superfamily)
MVAWGYLSRMDVDSIIRAAGGVAKLAAVCGLKHTSVIGWRTRGIIPAERVGDVARATGLSPAQIRPDLAAAFAAPSAGPITPPEAA